ncbi:MAG: hypothetical protein A3K76_01485 [Euryarchaeota archaeon RBG_13_57_23]|nr:MAG: hypothetical protein A3K76_01485 [Euryarchaeota archaeon RBG_13_57_23]
MLTLLTYKVKLFFAPSYRGKYGPLPLLALMILFVPSGAGMGYAFGAYIDTLGTEQVTETLGAAMSAMLAFGFVFSLGVGITAQPSELDFLMTSPIKSREYLIADLLFQLTSIMLAGGVAMFAALIGLLGGMGAPMVRAIPLALVMAAYGLMIVLIIQSITIARIRYPNARVRQLTLVLLVLSAVAMLPALGASIGIDFADLPIPQAAFAALANSAIFGTSSDVQSLVVAGVFFAAIGVLWLKMSKMYFFYGIKPTLSGGFGQVDMGTKMAQQRRMIGLFGGLTDKIALRTDVGGDLSLMTRLSLVRIWRDGSIVFVILLLGLFVGIGLWGSSSSEEQTGMDYNTLQGATWPIAILAINWCYYERENLWIPVVGGRSLVTYFRGLMTSLVLIGLAMSAFMIAIRALVQMRVDMAELAFMMLAPVGTSVFAAILLTRVRVKPGAFSPGLLVVLFVTFIGGAGIAFAGSLVVGAVGGGSYAVAVIQATITAVIAISVYYVGQLAVSNLSRTFKFQ